MRAARPPAEPRPRTRNATGRPLATEALVGLNVAVFVVEVLTMGTAGLGSGAVGRVQADLALFGPYVATGQWFRLVTSGFVHFGVLHILFNMIFCWYFGAMLEAGLGRLRLLTLYVACLLAGSFGALLLQPRAPSGGASGAVFGLIAAAAIGLHQRGQSIWQSGMGALIVLELVFSFADRSVSIGAHVGGLIAGFVVGAVMLRTGTDRRASMAQGLAAGLIVAGLCFAGGLWAAHRSVTVLTG